MVNIVMLTIEVLIFTAVVGVIFDNIANPNGNITGASLVLYGLIGLIVVAGFITALVKQLGLKGRR